MSDEKMQTAVNKFLKNPYWKGIYEGASENCKKFYEQNFAYSLDAVDKKEHTDIVVSLYKSFSDSDWDYLISHTNNQMSKNGYQKARENYSKKTEG
jgi:hypothetical protein